MAWGRFRPGFPRSHLPLEPAMASAAKRDEVLERIRPALSPRDDVMRGQPPGGAAFSTGAVALHDLGR